jgi:hypothetical protein
MQHARYRADVTEPWSVEYIAPGVVQEPELCVTVHDRDDALIARIVMGAEGEQLAEFADGLDSLYDPLVNDPAGGANFNTTSDHGANSENSELLRPQNSEAPKMIGLKLRLASEWQMKKDVRKGQGL